MLLLGVEQSTLFSFIPPPQGQRKNQNVLEESCCNYKPARRALETLGGMSAIVGAIWGQKAILEGKFRIFDPILTSSATFWWKKHSAETFL